MKWTDLNKYVLDRYEDAEILFDLNNCYFENNVTVDQLDVLDPFEKTQAIADYEMMGFRITNDDVVVPARLPFLIKPSSKSDPTCYYIVRNNVEIGISYPDELDVNIELSDIGRKCMLVGRDLDVTANYTGMYQAYDHIQSIENIFGTHIIKK